MSKKTSESHISEQRWSHELKRRKLKEERARKYAQRENVLGSEREVVRSTALDLFSATKFVQPIRRPKGDVIKIVIPQVFSLSRNPSETLSVIRRIATGARGCRRARIILDHRSVKDMGLGADSVLGLVLNGIQQEATHGSYIKGKKPQSNAISTMMNEVGCVRALNDFENPVGLRLSSDKKTFKYHNHATTIKTNPTDADTVSKTIQKFTDHLEENLKHTNKEFTTDGRQILLEYVGEVLNNADEHSGFREWMVVAYVDFEPEEPIYHSVIFSIGHTISETFQSLDKDSYSWTLVEPYLQAHSSKGFLGEDWRESDLLTIISLQEDMSSKSLSAKDTRGQGTVDLINFFQEMYDECTHESRSECSMSLLSGNTSILFDRKYRMKKDQRSNRKVIAFNKSNDLKQKPDPKCVQRIKNQFFPGVMISVRVPLGGDVIQSSVAPEVVYEN